VLNEFDKRNEHTSEIEIISKQLADEALKSYEELKGKMFELEKRYS